MDAQGQAGGSKWLAATLAGLFVLSLGMFLYVNYQAGDGELWQMILNGLILAIPLALLYGSIWVLAVAWQQHRSGGLSARMAKFVYRTPRIAGVLIILFITLFSFDVFEEGGNVWQMLGAFVMHSLPSIVLALVLWLAWKREWIGAVLFWLASLFFLRFVLFDPLEGIGMILLFAGPLIVIGLLFWMNWTWKSELRAV